ncbi:hypothetical protein D6745_01470 [Candidatus Woesearchaeota archaeon]|nr:MAG: hypothetical protein D6745_01470 [Candidatus Woesearchaeota archaeon]
MAEFDEVIKALKELCEDPLVPKNVKVKLQNTINSLNDDCELSIKVDRALNELDEISSDANIEPFTRTQIWNIVSLLESL